MTGILVDVPLFSPDVAGVVPASGGDPAKALFGDGLWKVPPVGGGGGGGRKQDCFQFFGPFPGSGYTTHLGPTYGFMTALTASTKHFFFNDGLSPIVRALWIVVWIPINPAASARLVHMDDGPLNITQIAAVPGMATPNPIVSYADVTAPLDALRQAGVYKSLGVQFKDDGFTDWRIYESRLEIVWD